MEINKMNTDIETKNGLYTYENIDLYYGRKLIDLEISKKNLLDFKYLLDFENVKFGIIYGTLLGAIREKNFIEYDEDIDVFILDENRELFISLLFKLRKIGFEVARYNHDLLSIIRDDDYIDIYFFRKNIFGQRICNGDSINSVHLDTFGKILFLDKEFNTPNNPISFLEKAYGKDWNVPKKNTPADVVSLSTKIKIKLKDILPELVISLLKTIKKRIKR